MIVRRSLQCRVLRACALLLIVVCPSIALAANGLTIIAPAAPGGGWDQTARVMQRVLGGIEPATIIQVDNVPGAAGTIGLARFVQSDRGNPDTLMVMGLVMVSGVITNHSPVNPGDATPIARLTGETEIIVVPASSPYRSMGDLVSAFTANPGSISWGGGSAGGTDDLLIRLLAEQEGLAASRVNYIAFAGGGAALAAVLGGQVTAGVSGYAEFAGQIEAGQLRVLAVSSPARVAGIDAPTLRESGIALDLENWRAVLAPPGLSDLERAALTERITRMAASEAWKKALAQNGWQDLFLAGPPFKQFLLSEQARIQAVLDRLTANESRTTAAAAMTVTPATVPNTFALLFGVATVAFLFSKRGSFIAIEASRPTAVLAAALVVQPLVYPLFGFVAAATLLFTATATAIQQTLVFRRVIIDAIVGLVLASLLFVAFTRFLGVNL